MVSNFFSLLLNLALQNANSTVQQWHTIAKYTDLNEDTCKHFYDHTCGKWTEKHIDDTYKEITGLIDHDVNLELLSLIRNSEYRETGTKEVMTKIRTYFKSCEAAKELRFSSYLELVKPADGLNWPLLDELNAIAAERSASNWQSEKFHWLLAVANLRQFGLNRVFLEQFVLQTANDTKTFVIDIDRPNLEAGYRLPDQLTVMSLVKSIGFKLSKVFQVSNELRDFESALYTLQKSSNDNDISFLTLAELRAELPQLPWHKYFRVLTNQTVADNFSLQLRNLAYFKSLTEFLNNTPQAVICTYLMVLFMYYAIYDARKSTAETDCMVDVRNKMDLALNFIYYESVYKQHAELYEKEVNVIFEALRTEFRNILSANKMKLNSVEREYFQNKLNAMKLRIGNVPANMNAKFVADYYRDLQLDSENYVQNQLSLRQLSFRKEHEPVMHPLRSVDDYFDKDQAGSSTPFYSQRMNWMTIPFGFLRTPIYHPEMHDALNYSLLGFNIGHEMAHGFDLFGILYDPQGRLNLEMAERIGENAQYVRLFECLEQSETSEVNERFADFIGLQLAHGAFTKTAASRDERVFGQPTQQVFFKSFAQFFCGNKDAEFVDHDEDKVRLEWSFIQNDAFRAAFNCKKTPETQTVSKCEMW